MAAVLMQPSSAQFAHTEAHANDRGGWETPKSSHCRWAGVHESDMGRVRELEAAKHALSVDSECWWACALCVDWKGWGGKGDVRAHLASE